MKTQETPSYIIGDVHGCFYTLKKLLAKLPKNADIIFVGDLCDKGLYSKEVIEYVISNDYQCVKGNHEHLMQKYLFDAVVHDKHSPWSEDYRYGGIQTYKSYLNDHESMNKHLAWIKKLPIYIQKENYFITHGYALPFYEHKDNEDYYNDFLLNRYEKEIAVPQSEVINIFGHCVFDEVIEHENFFAIDTGCSYGKKLTALELGSMKIIQENMDERDSFYTITELELSHMHLCENTHNLELLAEYIDIEFDNFDVVSTEVAAFIVQEFGDLGRLEIAKMLEKKQLFIKQAKKFLKDIGDLSA
jgi:serine/threonine protein phosphatase 1